MNKLATLGILPLLAGCGVASPPVSRGALQADPTAQSYGVHSYSVEANRTVLFDALGVEMGQLVVTDTSTTRVIDFEYADGRSDEIEAYRPLDGQFIAPIKPATVATAVVVDKALAPMFATHALYFLNLSALGTAEGTPSRSPEFTVPPIRASTTACSTSCDAKDDAWTCSAPTGCVRPANTSLGCANVSSSPAKMLDDAWTQTGHTSSRRYTGSLADCEGYCNDSLPTRSAVYSWAQNSSCYCGVLNSASEWIASCPRKTCGTVGDYDAVPSVDTCVDPGGCSFSTGPIGCIAAH